MLHEADPVNQMQLSACLKDALKAASFSHPDTVVPAFTQLDPAIAAQLQSVVTDA